jgi:hypothetical protein
MTYPIFGMPPQGLTVSAIDSGEGAKRAVKTIVNSRKFLHPGHRTHFCGNAG